MVSSALGSLHGADFLNLGDLSADQVEQVLDLAGRIKSGRWTDQPLAGRSIALLFQKPSMRTRVSFHVGVERLGGRPVILNDQEIGLGRREAVADVGRVLDRYVDGIVARLFDHHDLVRLAEASEHPVINALTDVSHPCQVLADVLTMRESLGRLDRTTPVVFVGDGNNVASSLMDASTLLGFPLTVIAPPAFQPPPRPGVRVTGDLGAVAGAAVVYTDVWTSMGQEAEAEGRRAQFAEYQVSEELMAHAPAALFMHCLPAHRGEEVAAGVIDGPSSVVFDQAGNRLYAQMALMAVLF